MVFHVKTTHTHFEVPFFGAASCVFASGRRKQWFCLSRVSYPYHFAEFSLSYFEVRGYLFFGWGGGGGNGTFVGGGGGGSQFYFPYSPVLGTAR